MSTFGPFTTPQTPSPRLFVTGGTGFVGRSFLRWRQAQGGELAALPMTLLSRDPARFIERYPQLCTNVEWVKGDVGNFAFPPGRFSHVLHAATDTTMEAAAEPEKLTRAIVDGTKHVLDFADACGAERVLYVSSGAVYGPQPADMEQLSEDYPGQPAPDDAAAAYGRAKRVAEKLACDWARGGKVASVARLFAFVGADLPLDTHFAIGNFIRDALRSDLIEVRGDGSPIRSYLEASDLSEWIAALLTRGQSGRAYNVGSDEAVDMAGLAETVARVVNPKARVRIAQARPDYAGRKRYVPSIARAKSELGLQVRVPLAEAIRRTAAVHRS